MKLRKSKVSMAVAATLGLACLAPSASFGSQEKYSVNTLSDVGTLSTDSRGDTLLFPFYTVANGSITTFSVTNTSSTQVVVAKIRFREQLHSVDVYDMHVILSPNDKFDFWLTGDGENNRPVLNWDDNTCVVGPLDSNARSVEFREAWQPYVKSDSQMRMGHLEVLGVVDISQTALAPYAIHQSGVPRNCRALASVFKSPARVSILNDDCGFEPGTLTDGDVMRVPIAEDCRTLATDGADEDLSGYGHLRDVGNVLMGRYIVSSRRELGMEAGGDAIAIRDTDIPNPNNAAHGKIRWSVTAHSETLCNAVNPPNCRTFGLYQWDLLEQAHPHLGEMWNLAGFQLAMGARSVGGDWSNNPENKVNVDWMVSFPTKYAYMDFNHAEDRWELLYHPTAQQSISGIAWPFADGVWQRTALSTPNITLAASFRVWDTEERGTGDVSPGDPFLYMQNEANIFTLLNTEVLPQAWDSIIQANGGDRLSRQIVDFKLPNAKRGWAKMELLWPGNADVNNAPYGTVVDFDSVDLDSLSDVSPGSNACTGEGVNHDTGYYADISVQPLAEVPTQLKRDGVCDDLYNNAFDNKPEGEPAPNLDPALGSIVKYPRPYLSGEGSDRIPDAINCKWSPYLCTPPSDAVTGIIFTTRDLGNAGNNDATLTELQKFQ